MVRQWMTCVGTLLCVAGCGPAQPTSPNAKKADTPESEVWLDAGKQAYKADDVEVRVTGVRFGDPHMREARELKAHERLPDRKLVIVYLDIKNKSAKKMNHLSWARSDGHFRPKLQDDQSNGYAHHAFTYCGEVDNVKTADVAIPAGQSGRDLVAFEAPIDKVSTFKLRLPGMQVGVKGDICFTIPVAMVERK